MTRIICLIEALEGSGEGLCMYSSILLLAEIMDDEMRLY